jgi:hypothetical protein
MMNAVVAIHFSIVGKPELSRKLSVWIRKPSLSGKPGPAIVSADESIH